MQFFKSTSVKNFKSASVKTNKQKPLRINQDVHLRVNVLFDGLSPHKIVKILFGHASLWMLSLSTPFVYIFPTPQNFLNFLIYNFQLFYHFSKFIYILKSKCKIEVYHI